MNNKMQENISSSQCRDYIGGRTNSINLIGETGRG
nr:MAG TPA: hypothetical protein [Caudoviricetes sp.]